MAKKTEIEQTEIEAPYELPEGWKWCKIIDAAECLDGRRKPINAEERAGREGNIPYYGATGQVGYIDDYLTDEELVLVGEDGAPFLNLIKDKAYLIKGKAWVNNHAHILRSRYGTSGNKYLLHYLNNFNYTGYVNGTTRLKLTQGTLLSMPFPLPPTLEEQQRIVARIETLFAKLDEAKEKAQTVVDTFETRKAAILHQAFTGHLTAPWRQQHNISDDSWEEKQGAEIFEFVTSGSRGWADYYSDHGSVFIRMGNLNHGTIELDLSEIQYVALPENAEGTRTKLELNDILISITADVGMIGLVRELQCDSYVNQHVALARPVKTLSSEFLAWELVSDVGLKQLQKKQKGATKVGLGLADIRNLKLCIPSLPEQQEIVRILDTILEKETKAKEAATSVLDQIDLLKKSILARAFRGEL